jgi:hypothetical protein
MATDIPATLRRYPSIWITTTPLGDPDELATQDVPVPRRLGPVPTDEAPPGDYSTIIVQPFSQNHELEVQFCDERGWGVSQQCPRANLYGYPAGSYDEDWEAPWLPMPVLGEYAGVDRPVQLDVYASTQRVYIMIEGRPAGCAVLPEGRMPSGPVTVAFGNAAYHIEIDSSVDNAASAHQFWHRTSLSFAQRRWDDLGINNGEAAPPWDESVLPCGTQYYAGVL